MATKNFTQFNTATPLTTSDYVVGYNAAGTDELKTTVKDIIDLVQDSDNQTLSFDSNTKDLSITSGNTVSLSSLSDTAFAETSSSFATNTLLQSTSALLTPLTLTNTLTGQLVLNTDFNSYKTNVASATATLLPTTVYQNASGSFATNTLLQSTSALLTPLTLTNTLTGQLVLNTNFDLYKTNVASATATLLPATIYQSASGSFATNTLFQSTSALLTPLTLTNTLTSQLVLNTNFDLYKTNVAAATATLLPATIYQSASGNWQDTFTNVQSNSANWDFGYDVATYVQANSADWEESADITAITTTVASNSGNWNIGYDVATTYQSVSGSFATNTLLQSTSALLTPLTLTNTLTSQLVLNTNFDLYKTNVAAATALFTPLTLTNTLTGQINSSIIPTVTNYLSTNNVQILVPSFVYDGTAAATAFVVGDIPEDYAPSNTDITQLYLGNGVTTIGDDAFNGCTGLAGALVIPDSVTSIGDYAFMHATGLAGPASPSATASPRLAVCVQHTTPSPASPSATA
jgi:hypothetical protein